MKWSELKTVVDLPPARCKGCGEEIDGYLNYRTCRAGFCTEAACARCGTGFASFGPVGCWCCSPYRWPSTRRTRQAYRRRQAFRSRWRR